VRLEAEPDHIGVWPDRRNPGDTGPGEPGTPDERQDAT
jgi:hypothetical protein